MSKRPLRSYLLLCGLPIVAALLWLCTAYPLSGQLADAETGQSLPGAAVSIAGQEARTDPQGAFHLRGLRGLPLLRAQAPGYRPLSATLSLGDLLRIGRALALRLEPVALRGTVIDAATGAPIPGATVRAGEQEVQADAQGRYAVLRLLPGTQLMASARYYRSGAPVSYAGQEVQDLALSLLPATVTVRDLCTGRPLAGATVNAGAETVQSDGQGLAFLAHLQPQTLIQAGLPGYGAASGRASPGEKLSLDLRPTAVGGIVRGEAGQPIADALVLAPLPGQEPRLTYTDAAGEYRLEGVPVGATLVVRKAGYARAQRQRGGEACCDFQLQPFVARGIYLAFHMLTPAYQAQRQADLDLVDRTELNAIVIEIKTETGFLGFQPRLPLAREIGAGDSEVIDVRKLLADCRSRGIYTIARFAVFEDDLLGSQRPEWAIHTANGAVWRAAGGRAWVDPFRKEVWDYEIALAKEAVELGFDEIQFDYVRFPSDGDVLNCRYIRQSTAATRVEAISSFLAYARQELDKTGAFLSADLFGLTTFDSEEKGIGQLMERVAPHVDYVSPMVYPSTYLRGMLDIQDPWRSPYEVVKLSLLAAHRKTPTLIRPWLQHFDDYHGLDITYGLRELRLQKQAAADGGSWGWLFWNILGEYDPAVFDPQ